MKRFRLRLGTLLIVVAVLALLLVVAIQQVQLGRQQVQIKQVEQRINGNSIERNTLTKIIREQRDQIERNK